MSCGFTFSIQPAASILQTLGWERIPPKTGSELSSIKSGLPSLYDVSSHMNAFSTSPMAAWIFAM
jgi:hypothetical protein